MKTAVITGASSGIGEALALELASRGYHLVLLARRESKLHDLAKRCQEVFPAIQTLVIPTDVTQKSDLENAMKLAQQKFPSIDVVIANAGFSIRGRVDRLTIEDFHRQFRTNIDGVLHTYYAFIEALKKSKGSFAILGSVQSEMTNAKSAAYAMSKHAMKALAGSLWLEHLDDGVSVTLICPGLVKSEIQNIDNQGHYRDQKKDNLPEWLFMETSKAAKQMITAILKRKREIVITRHGKFLVFFVRHFQGFSFFLQKILRKSISSKSGVKHESK